jgi:hypothetical protein
VCEAFRLCDLRVDDAYTVPLETNQRIKEEIDGLATLGWQAFLIQCKLEKDPIARLHLQVERRPVGTLGLFFADEYSEAAVELAAELRPIRVILLTAAEINRALTSPGHLGHAQGSPVEVARRREVRQARLSPRRPFGR